MEIEKFMELTATLEKKKTGKKENLEKVQTFFERFHLLNRKYLDRDAFEKALGSIPAIAEAVSTTVQYLEAEIARLRSKRSKLPVENVELAEMQKIEAKNEMLLKDLLAQFAE
jgi:hypothetical protein